jgi:hypothetical protein
MPADLDYSAQPWWPKCISLSQVLGRLGPPDVRQRYADLREETSTLAVLRSVLEHGEVIDGLGAASARLSAFREVQDGQKRLVLEAIRQGTLLAYGYEHPRRIADRPVAVPLTLWRHRVHWDKGEIEGEGIKVIGVRVVTLKTVQALNHDTPQPKDRGRPTREAQILAAHDLLLETGIIKQNDTFKAKAATIRAHVLSQEGKPSSRTDGLSDETIRRVLTNRPQNTKS